MQSYDYANRSGEVPISWERFAQLAAALAEQIAAQQPDAVVGIARAGLLPATLIACMLRRDLYPVRVSRRVQDEVRFERPVWRVDVSDEVAGRRVVVIDEIADTGETLALVAARVRERGAAHVLTAALVSHSWASPAPDLSALVSDALVLFPWDQQVYQDGRWQPHPELAAARLMQRPDNQAS